MTGLVRLLQGQFAKYLLSLGVAPLQMQHYAEQHLSPGMPGRQRQPLPAAQLGRRQIPLAIELVSGSDFLVSRGGGVLHSGSR